MVSEPDKAFEPDQDPEAVQEDALDVDQVRVTVYLNISDHRKLIM